MTTLQNRPNTALLIVDVQVGVVAGAYARDAVVTNIGTLIEKARREQVFVPCCRPLVSDASWSSVHRRISASAQRSTALL